MKEIERQFIVSDFKVPESYHQVKIEHQTQSYLLATSTAEVRLRESSVITDDGLHNECTLTIKSGNGLQRDEYEYFISNSTYNDLLGNLTSKPIYKLRITYYSELTAHYLEYNEVDNGTYNYVEVEFSSVEEADNYTPEFDYISEVTDKPEYKLKNYWNRTRNL